MTKSEVAKILTIIANMYSKFEVNPVKAELWHDMLKDIPYELAQMAVKKVMLTSEFPPNIAQIRKAVAEITTNKEDSIDAGQAWGEVQRAIQKWGWPEPEKAMQMMSPLTRRVVEQLSWREICTAEEIGVIRGQFMKMYNIIAERQKEAKLLPKTFNDDIKKLTNNFMMLNKGMEK